MPAQAKSSLNMPAPSSKKSIIGKTPAPQKYQPSTVRDCMVWSEKGTGKKGKKNSKADFEEPDQQMTITNHRSYIHEKPEVGKPKMRGFELHTPPPRDINRDETVIRALRGWSDSYPDQEQHEDEGVVTDQTMEEYTEFMLYKDEQGRVQSKKKTGSKKDKKDAGRTGGIMAEYDDDVHMGDILSYRFGNQEAQRRAKQQEREQRKKEKAAANAADTQRAMKNVRHNQASIGRTNCNTEKITKVDHDLWKMSKFTKKAKPVIDSRRNKPFSHHNGNDVNGVQNGGNTSPLGGECTHKTAADLYADGFGIEQDFSDMHLKSPSPNFHYAEADNMLDEGPYASGNASRLEYDHELDKEVTFEA